MRQIDPAWKGYSIDELRVKRLVTIAKIDLEQLRLQHLTEKYTNKGDGLISSGGIFSKLLGALDYMDYGLLAYKFGKSVFKRLRRKRG